MVGGPTGKAPSLPAAISATLHTDPGCPWAWIVFRERFGMPFSLVPKSRVAAIARACRAIVAARLADPGSEWRVLRTLQLANFTTPCCWTTTPCWPRRCAACPGWTPTPSSRASTIRR